MLGLVSPHFVHLRHSSGICAYLTCVIFVLAGTLAVRHGSHQHHARFWREGSRMAPEDQNALGDFHIFSPQVRCDPVCHRTVTNISVIPVSFAISVVNPPSPLTPPPHFHPRLQHPRHPPPGSIQSEPFWHLDTSLPLPSSTVFCFTTAERHDSCRWSNIGMASLECHAALQHEACVQFQGFRPCASFPEIWTGSKTRDI